MVDEEISPRSLLQSSLMGIVLIVGGLAICLSYLGGEYQEESLKDPLSPPLLTSEVAEKAKPQPDCTACNESHQLCKNSCIDL